MAEALSTGRYAGSTSSFIGKSAPAGDLSVGSTVWIKINGVPKEFIIVHQGLPDKDFYQPSCEGTWLLMKEIYTTMQFLETAYDDNGDAYADEWSYYYGGEAYPDSGTLMTKYLNYTFYNLIEDSVKNKIVWAQIPCSSYYESVESLDKYDYNQHRVFLLSSSEIGCNEYIYSSISPVVVGRLLQYFIEDPTLMSSDIISEASNLRIAYLNGEAHSWWIRSQVYNSYNANCACYVKTNGAFSGNATNTTSGVRPAFIVPFDTVLSTVKNA